MNTHIAQSSHTIMVNEGMMDIPVPEILLYLSRVIDQLSDGLIFGRLFQASESFFCISLLRQLVDLLAYYLQSKDELATLFFAILQAVYQGTLRLRVHDTIYTW